MTIVSDIVEVIDLPFALISNARHSETSSFCYPSILGPSSNETSSLTIGSTLGKPLTKRIKFSITTFCACGVVVLSPSAFKNVVCSYAAIALAESAYFCWISFKAKKI